jgi:hypothetical protein
MKLSVISYTVSVIPQIVFDPAPNFAFVSGSSGGAITEQQMRDVMDTSDASLKEQMVADRDAIVAAIEQIGRDIVNQIETQTMLLATGINNDMSANTSLILARLDPIAASAPRIEDQCNQIKTACLGIQSNTARIP